MITKSELDKIVEKLHDVAPTKEGVNLFYRCYFRVWNCLNVYVDSEKTRKCLEHDLLIMQGLYDKAIQKWNMYVKKIRLDRERGRRMKKIITIKRLNCPVCGMPMMISDVRRHNNPMEYYDEIQEMEGVEVVYVCTNDEHAIKTEVEIYRGYIEDDEE